jgi:hypothetical protein
MPLPCYTVCDFVQEVFVMRLLVAAFFMALLVASPGRAENGQKEGGRDVGEGFRKIGTETGRAFKEGGKEVGHGFRKIGTETGQAAKKTGRSVGEWFTETGKNTGEAFRQMGRDIRSFFKGE